jgi:hypothetical protein
MSKLICAAATISGAGGLDPEPAERNMGRAQAACSVCVG